MQVRPHEPVCSQSALRAPHHPRGRGEVIGGIKRADAQLHGGRGSPACNLACTIATVRGRGDSPTPLQPLLFYPFALLHSTLHFFQSAIFSGATQNRCARNHARERKQYWTKPFLKPVVKLFFSPWQAMIESRTWILRWKVRLQWNLLY